MIIKNKNNRRWAILLNNYYIYLLWVLFFNKTKCRTLSFNKIKFLFNLFPFTRSKLISFHVLSSIISILFWKMFWIMCSLNSKWEKECNNLSSLINLFFNRFFAAYSLLSILTIWALLALLFLVYILHDFSHQTLSMRY